ncbi:hypothetical protein Tco_0757351 [Tanacetum coccineum]
MTSLTKSDDDSLTVSQVNDFDGGQEEQVGKSDQMIGSLIVGSLEQDTRLVKAIDPRIMTLRAPPKKASLKVLKEDSISTKEQYSGSGPQKPKFQKHVQNDDGSGYVYRYSNTPPSSKFFQGGSGSRQLKGNQELNDELKVKANELEKLFAEHKLRVLGDQPNPTHQSKASNVESDQTTRLAYRKQVADPIPEHQRIDDSQGKLYDSYMKKRDAKMRESWDSNGAKKEARMKAMNDSLERHSTEMKATFLRGLKIDKILYLVHNDMHKISGLSRNIQGKKLFVRTPIPRSAIKLTSTFRKQRTQPDNPFAQSVPNFSDLRKENTKPYSTASKAVAHSQLRNYTHNRSNNNEEMSSVKEDKSRRSQSLRKSSVTSLASSEDVILTPPNKGYMKSSKNVEPRTKSDKPISEPDVKDDGLKELDTTETEDYIVAGEVKSRMRPESEILINSELENGNTSQSFSQVDHLWLLNCLLL